ncbi:MAG TPA: hypothetical protein PLO69_10995 [Gammaproteobacteria bacterium]|nr:hypothetical protein [Gammaproteobacteria bacterium]
MKLTITQLDMPPAIPPAVVSGIAASLIGGQANATLLTGFINVVTSGTGGSVVLKILSTNTQRVLNRTGGTLTVYPVGATQIEANGLNVPVTIGAGGEAAFYFDNVQTWFVGA